MKTINSQSEFNNSREFVIANSCVLDVYEMDFIPNMLENEYTNLAFRIAVLEHTIEDIKVFKPYEEKLQRLGRIRNTYAHTLPNEIEKDGKS